MITIQPMVDTFTLNQLVRYTYNECSPTESQLIEEFADSDCDISNEINELREARKGLPKVLFYPHRDTIRSILDYSLISG
ncbi:MAG: hypothetical protein IPM86_08030 [Saprospiraceae bacterium]|nr:hypothetical protein [Saprospiraceae bacterium]